MNAHFSRLHPGLLALLEVGVLFLPAVPAYLWVWPVLSGEREEIFQIIVYLYVLAGTLFIALRAQPRSLWLHRLSDLGLNRRGFALSAACGLTLLAARLMLIYSVDFGLSPPRVTLLGLAVNILYYLALVGLVEELLFRGLIYRALEEWLGPRWGTGAAIWGSSIGFLLWHIFGQGPVIGLSGLIVGLIFALIRWRTGSLLWLIFLHAMWDLETVLLVGGSNSEIMQTLPPPVLSPALLYLGTLLLVLPPLFLWMEDRLLVVGYWLSAKKR